MIQVAAFYRFAVIPEPLAWREALRAFCLTTDLQGTILIAGEGLNGTVAGSPAAVVALQAYLETLPGFAGLTYKMSFCDTQPFGHMRVKCKREIVTMGVPELPIAGHTGTYVAPRDWDALITRPEVVVVDTRNDYEVCEGSFAGALDPRVSSFSEFPQWVDQHLDPQRDQHVAMYCTGGIRCEKATALLRAKGFANVYHLEGGILSYFAEKNGQAGTWDGTCFVFDQRRTVDRNLTPVPDSPRSQALQDGLADGLAGGLADD
jgi:UPF0176 protein